MRPLSAFASLFLLSLITSCSSKKRDTSLDSVEGFCAAWAAAACNGTVVENCAGTADATATDSCKVTQEVFCASLVPDGKYSSNHAKECIDAVGAAYSDGKLDADERDTVLHLQNGCSQVLSGPGGKNADCSEDSDCDRNSGLSCVKKTGTTGKCEAPTVVGGGLDCSAPEAVCATGFHCDARVNSCLGGAAPGADCSTEPLCDATSRCVTSTGDDGGAGKAICVARSASGVTCTVDDECATRICSIPQGGASGKCAQNPPALSSTTLCDNLM